MVQLEEEKEEWAYVLTNYNQEIKTKEEAIILIQKLQNYTSEIKNFTLFINKQVP